MSQPRQGRGPRRAKAAVFVVAISISYSQMLYPKVNDVLNARVVAPAPRPVRKQRRQPPASIRPDQSDDQARHHPRHQRSCRSVRHWDRIEKTTMRRPLADAPVPTAVPGIMHVTERSRTFHLALRGEIFAQGYTTENYEKDLPRLEGSIVAWLNYLYRVYAKAWFVNAVVRIYPQDRAFVSLPEKLDFLYHLVRPLRLTAKYSLHFARRLLRGH
jgi:hypothetical protein